MSSFKFMQSSALSFGKMNKPSSKSIETGWNWSNSPTKITCFPPKGPDFCLDIGVLCWLVQPWVDLTCLLVPNQYIASYSIDNDTIFDLTSCEIAVGNSQSIKRMNLHCYTRIIDPACYACRTYNGNPLSSSLKIADYFSHYSWLSSSSLAFAIKLHMPLTG